MDILTFDWVERETGEPARFGTREPPRDLATLDWIEQVTGEAPGRVREQPSDRGEFRW